MRSYQYLDYLRHNGIEVTVAPLLSNEYIENLYQKRETGIRKICKFYLSRLSFLINAKKYDLIWVEKEIFPWFPAVFEYLLERLRIPYIVDFDDAVFHFYDTHPNYLVRNFFKNKIRYVIRRAEAVVVGNSYLYDYAISAGAKYVEIIPTVIDFNRYSCKDEYNSQFTIGWIGSPSTSKNLNVVESSLKSLVIDNKDIQVMLIGADSTALLGLSLQRVSWSDNTEVESLRKLDVGIMPLVNEPFEHGKCGYKLIQYMACGLPVVASPIGVNNDIVKEGQNGFLAKDNREWEERLYYLYKNPRIRKEMGLNGRALVEKSYCIQVTSGKVSSLIEKSIRNFGK